MKYLVTGGAGFIGSNLIRHILDARPKARVVNLDALTYAGNLDNLADVAGDPRYTFVHGDICDGDLVSGVMRGVTEPRPATEPLPSTEPLPTTERPGAPEPSPRPIDVVFHLAAESHVDRSIVSDAPFVRTNVMGTQTLLAAALEAGVGRFVHVSTDEVYGELPWRDPSDPDPSAPRFTEDTPLAPRSPYAATKAASDHLALAYHTTHGMDVLVTRCSNNYGPYQFPEKLIPLAVTHALDSRPVPVYGDGLNVRDWIHVEDHCRGLMAAAEQGRAGRVYNFGGDAERTNLQVVRGILKAMGRSESLIEHVSDRPGHDRRYAVDASRARDELGWNPTTPFEAGLESTVRWYVENQDWWRRVKSGAYWKDYEDIYGKRG